MSKVSAQWVPDQMHTSLIMSQANLVLFEADPDNFLEHFLTQDECWVHHFEPGTKGQYMQWKHPSSLLPKKAKVVSSAGQVMVSVMQRTLRLLTTFRKAKQVMGN